MAQPVASARSRRRNRRLVQQAGHKSHPHEVRQTLRLHFGHDVRAIDLDRPRTDPKVERDGLIRVAGKET